MICDWSPLFEVIGFCALGDWLYKLVRMVNLVMNLLGRVCRDEKSFFWLIVWLLGNN